MNRTINQEITAMISWFLFALFSKKRIDIFPKASILKAKLRTDEEGRTKMEFAAKNCQMQVMPMNMLMSSMPFSVEANTCGSPS
ncbi:MAG: hypothetical protein LKE56_02340 [Lactobacillus delbrueckii]|nr:hypothetical protein [Lactobacillus delbrueckii]